MLLDLCNILRLKAFIGFRNIEFDASSLLQRAVAFAANGAKMNKYILALFSFNKAESLGVVEPFYGSRLSLRHGQYLFIIVVHDFRIAKNARRQILQRSEAPSAIKTQS